LKVSLYNAGVIILSRPEFLFDERQHRRELFIKGKKRKETLVVALVDNKL
jgi:hypothetical protein